jgi:putative tricarboxylic transport membrane protein
MEKDMAEKAPSLLPHERPLPPRVDLWTGAFFLLLSLVIVSLAVHMPRFAEQKGEIYTAPGLVPGIYGVVIGILSVWLITRSLRRLAAGEAVAEGEAGAEGNSSLRLALAAALGLIFCVGLIGRMPFWAAAALFVTAFIVLFEWRRGDPWSRRATRFATAALQGVITGVAVMLVFEKMFYVRLP